MEDMSNYSLCKKRTVFLEKRLQTREDAHAGKLETLNEACINRTNTLRSFHQSNIEDLQETCKAQLQATLGTCTNNSIVEELSESVAQFSHLLAKKRKEIKNCKSNNAELEAKLEKCKDRNNIQLETLKTSYEKKLTQMHNAKRDQDLELNRYIQAGHHMVNNMSKLQIEHKVCTLEKEKCIIDHTNTHNRLVAHTHNISDLTTSISVYKDLVNVWQKKDNSCMASLSFCREQNPVKDQQLTHLRNAHKQGQTLYSQCLKEKNIMLQNMTTCQRDIVSKNVELQTEAKKHSDTHTMFLTNKLKFGACNASNNDLRMQAIEDKNQLLMLEKHNSDLQKELADLTLLYNKSQSDFATLQLNLKTLDENYKAQQLTIEQLLEEEKQRNTIWEAEKTTCLQYRHEKEEAKRIMSNWENAYWANKRDLTQCLASKPYENLNETSHKSNVSLLNYYNRRIHTQTNLIVQCMRNVTNLNATQFNMHDLEKLVHVTKNIIPVNKNIFTSSNSIKGCNLILDSCRSAVNKLQRRLVTYLKQDCTDPTSSTDTTTNQNTHGSVSTSTQTTTTVTPPSTTKA